MEVTKTPAEWIQEFGDVRIMDPDGWRYDSTPIDKPLTRKEFVRRLGMCTLAGKNIGNILEA